MNTTNRNLWGQMMRMWPCKQMLQLSAQGKHRQAEAIQTQLAEDSSKNVVGSLRYKMTGNKSLACRKLIALHLLDASDLTRDRYFN